MIPQPDEPAERQMRLNITVDLDNDAFYTPGEVSVVLARIAAKVERGDDCGTVLDTNGNTVGTFETVLR